MGDDVSSITQLNRIDDGGIRPAIGQKNAYTKDAGTTIVTATYCKLAVHFRKAVGKFLLPRRLAELFIKEVCTPSPIANENNRKSEGGTMIGHVMNRLASGFPFPRYTCPLINSMLYTC